MGNLGIYDYYEVDEDFQFTNQSFQFCNVQAFVRKYLVPNHLTTKKSEVGLEPLRLCLESMSEVRSLIKYNFL
jgi:hypothetical protein